jgi:catechol 2,3-dioxygenase-like lactoylglutathione lyase family enzyme
MSSIATFVAVTIDCADPAALAGFYHEVTGWDVMYSSADYAYLGSEGTAAIGLQRVADYAPPSWPDPAKQMHLDFRVADLVEARERLVALGATRPEFQPGGDKWIVLTDPAGHPFCITTAA